MLFNYTPKAKINMERKKPISKFFYLIFLFVNYINSINEISYYFKPIIDSKETFLKITLIFRTDNTNSTKIILPDYACGQDLYRQIRNFKLEMGPAVSNTVSNAVSNTYFNDTNIRSVKLINHQPYQQIVLSYEIHNSNLPFSGHRPYLKKEFIRFASNWVLAKPAFFTSNNIRVSFYFDIPNSWSAISSFGIGSQNVFGSLKLLEDSFFIFADTKAVRIHKLLIKSNPVYLAIYGKYELSDQEICKSLENIITSQRNFFNDHNFPTYGISLMQYPEPTPNSNYLAGSGYSNFFDLCVSEKSSLLDFNLICCHEHFHTWNGQKIMSSHDELLYWFSEGFTEYYTLISALRAGILNYKQFIEQINKSLALYYTSDVINAPNKRIKDEFWLNSSISRLPYNRGLVFAILLNYKIKKATYNRYCLDDFMKDLFAHCQATNEKVTVPLLDRLIKRYILSGIYNDIVNYIDNGQTIWLDNGMIDNVGFFIRPIGTYNLGFDFDYLKKNRIISNVNVNSNAYKAGLRNGQKVNAWSLWSEPFKECSVTVNNQEIKFFPQGPPFKNVPTYYVK